MVVSVKISCRRNITDNTQNQQHSSIKETRTLKGKQQRLLVLLLSSCHFVRFHFIFSFQMSFTTKIIIVGAYILLSEMSSIFLIHNTCLNQKRINAANNLLLIYIPRATMRCTLEVKWKSVHNANKNIWLKINIMLLARCDYVITDCHIFHLVQSSLALLLYVLWLTIIYIFLSLS